MNIVARRVEVRGRVQGVGFRDAAVDAAHDCAVTGWIRNREDGSVEACAQGTPEAVERFIAWCRRGPPSALVDAITVVEWPADSALGGFQRRRSDR